MSDIKIRHVEIKRFRTVRSFTWCPSPRLNVILGPADSGKSTLLEALGLLFSAAPTYPLSEFDYFNREVDAGFSIQAVVSVGTAELLKSDNFPAPPLQGWLRGKLTDLPDEDSAEAVLVCRVEGTPEQEAEYQILGAGGDIRVPFNREL